LHRLSELDFRNSFSES